MDKTTTRSSLSTYISYQNRNFPDGIRWLVLGKIKAGSFKRILDNSSNNSSAFFEISMTHTPLHCYRSDLSHL